jgi:cob(I)alamin adenosyltransferase
MDEKPFREPVLALNRIYTKSGDTGETGLVGGQRVGKDDLRLECYGTVDELNSHIGMAIALAGAPESAGLRKSLTRIQHELFNLGSILATLPSDVGPQQPRVTESEISQVEREIDEMNAGLPALQSFVLPGGSALNAQLHICRTVCRRAERLVVALDRQSKAEAVNIGYLNRLSDLLFVQSRYASALTGTAEVLWQPNQPKTNE